MRLSLAVVVASFAVACNCNRPPGQTQDSGPDGTQCMSDSDCPLGYQCSANLCVAPTSFDGSSGCVSDNDCPSGQRCLRSTGQCITPMDGGDVLPDAGPTGDCFEGQVTSCGTSKLGDCKLGTSTCMLVDGRWQLGPCVGEVDPKPETCNGTDENCDGQIDDGLGSSSCGVGECARTVPACSGGMPGTCTPGAGSAEVCDGKDNDCNGMTDEGLTATCGVGACRRTQTSCVDGGSVACVPGAPGTETCNGIDDNCDGNTDEGIGSTACGTGACARLQPNCVMGMPKTCMPGTPGTETCNGIDDNCNGTIDEGCMCTPGATQGCYSGPAGTSDAGICHGGSQFCDAGTWGPCNGQVLPAAKETCNHLDDDCNGQTDEGLGTSSCGVGACARTVPTCVNGVTQSCDAGMPVAEACNNIDDNCNGITDDVTPATQMCGLGACQRTMATCANGMSVMCVAGMAGTETCNGIDDNCNGMTDEAFPQSGMSCSTGLLGVCGTGVYQCSGGTLSCAQTKFPMPENCTNMLDDDCNGVVNDPLVCGGCNPAIDADLDTYSQCTDCNDNNGAIHPMATELCDGLDNNCNMQIDEGFDVDMDTFTTCGTKPGGGIDPLRVDCNDNNAFVFPLKLTDCGNMATPTTANGVDDNCNGAIDETCNCNATDKDGDHYSTCAGDCDDNNKLIHPDAGESCNGVDDDCNKATVDNCGVSDPCGSKVGPSYVPFPMGTDQCKPDLVCVHAVVGGALTCGSYCNQTVGLGLNDSCQATEGCFSPLIDSDDLQLCAVTPVGAGATGSVCTAANQCRSGQCASTYCTDLCTHQAGCSANTTCTITKIVGGPPQRLTNYLTQCTLSSQITGTKTVGQACTAGQCKTGPDGCFGGVCVAPCCSHSDCGMGSVCTLNGPMAQLVGGTQISGVPVCVASAATRIAGQACTASSQCKSGVCDAMRGICADVCCNDTTCPTGMACRPLELDLADGGIYDLARVCVFAPYPAVMKQK